MSEEEATNREPEQTANKQYLLADEHHDALPSFRQQLKHYFVHDRRNLARMLSLGLKTGIGIGASRMGMMRDEADRNEKELMAFFNGENTRDLANKYTFVEEIKKLGYDQAIDQVLVTPEKPDDTITDEFSQTFPDLNRRVFIKKFGVGKGLGIEVVPVKELQKKLPEIRKAESAVVQNKVAVERAFRAISVDNPQNGTVIEHYFEAHIPTVTGDGARTVRDLLLESSDIPEASKKKLLRDLGSTLNMVPGRNLRINLGDVGHDTRGGYYSTPDEETVRNVRAFASSLKADLEKKVGHAIPVFCIDLAALDKQILEGDFNLDEAKKRFVAFEFQMGFDPGFDRPSTYPPFIGMLPMARYKPDTSEADYHQSKEQKSAVLPEQLPSRADLERRPTQTEWFLNPDLTIDGYHNVAHHAGVAIFAPIIGNKLKELAEAGKLNQAVADRKDAGMLKQLVERNMEAHGGQLVLNMEAIDLAAKCHDVRRKGDYELSQAPHAERGEQYLRDVIAPQYPADLSQETLDLACHIIRNHGTRDKSNIADLRLEDIVFGEADKLEFFRAYYYGKLQGPLNFGAKLSQRMSRYTPSARAPLNFYLQISRDLVDTTREFAEARVKHPLYRTKNQFQAVLDTAQQLNLLRA